MDGTIAGVSAVLGSSVSQGPNGATLPAADTAVRTALVALATSPAIVVGAGYAITRSPEAMAKIILMSAIVMGVSYLSEYFAAWYGGNRADRALVQFEFTGAYWPLYAAMLFCNVLEPQILWFPRARASLAVLIAVSVGVLAGMWLERILIIIWNTRSQGFLPSMDRVFYPTL